MTWVEFKFSSCDRTLIPVWISEDSHKEHVGKDYWDTSISQALGYCQLDLHTLYIFLCPGTLN